MKFLKKTFESLDAVDSGRVYSRNYKKLLDGLNRLRDVGIAEAY